MFDIFEFFLVIDFKQRPFAVRIMMTVYDIRDSNLRSKFHIPFNVFLSPYFNSTSFVVYFILHQWSSVEQWRERL